MATYKNFKILVNLKCSLIEMTVSCNSEA
jgi:hypothetical protein